MKIRNTDVEARYPWPEGVFVQGGGDGLVVSRSTNNHYRTAFVEAFPAGTFLRGEGATVEEAEQAAWQKYQVMMNCPGGGQHGPYEARHFTNGSGYCTKCGTWFPHVLEPTLEHRIGREACDRMQARWGNHVVGTAKWRGLVADERNAIRAEMGLEAPKPRTTEDPTPDELAEALNPPTAADIEAMLVRLADLGSEAIKRGEALP